MKKLLSILTTMTLALAASPAMAAEENQYARVGNWRIISNGYGATFVYCAAESDNGQVAVRIATDTRNWGIAVPYYDQGPVKGGIGFAGVQGWVDFETSGDGWAATRIQPQGLVELKRQNWLYIELDRGIQRFSLNGSSAAIERARECAANQGYT